MAFAGGFPGIAVLDPGNLGCYPEGKAMSDVVITCLLGTGGCTAPELLQREPPRWRSVQVLTWVGNYPCRAAIQIDGVPVFTGGEFRLRSRRGATTSRVILLVTLRESLGRLW
jgi:hypothetical protein